MLRLWPGGKALLAKKHRLGWMGERGKEKNLFYFGQEFNLIIIYAGVARVLFAMLLKAYPKRPLFFGEE
jgi:hypothetical protein